MTHTSPNQTSQLILLIRQAQTLAKLSIALGALAVGVFLVFGTLASMAAFRDSTAIFWAFYYLPYLLIGLSLPISLYHAFLLHRYRLIQPTILLLIMLLGVGLGVGALIMGEGITRLSQAFLALIVWFSLPFLVKLHLGRFLTFLEQENHNDHSPT